MCVPKVVKMGERKRRREEEGHSLSLMRLKNRKQHLPRQYVGNCGLRGDVDSLGES